MIIKQDTRPNKMIWVTFRKEGIHKYPAALTDPNLATGDEYDVSFLGYPHRHIFHFRVYIVSPIMTEMWNLYSLSDGSKNCILATKVYCR